MIVIWVAYNVSLVHTLQVYSGYLTNIANIHCDFHMAQNILVGHQKIGDVNSFECHHHVAAKDIGKYLEIIDY